MIDRPVLLGRTAAHVKAESGGFDWFGPYSQRWNRIAQSQSKRPKHVSQVEYCMHVGSHSTRNRNHLLQPGGSQIPRNDRTRIGQKVDRQIETLQPISDEVPEHPLNEYWHPIRRIN